MDKRFLFEYSDDCGNAVYYWSENTDLDTIRNEAQDLGRRYACRVTVTCLTVDFELDFAYIPNPSYGKR